MFGDGNKNIRMKQRHLHLLLPVAPLAYYFLHGEEDVESFPEKDIAYFFFVTAFGVEDEPGVGVL